MNFEFATASRIVFGQGRSGQIADIARPFGRRAFVVTGRQTLKASGKLGILEESLDRAGVGFASFAGSGEPDIETVGLALAEARRTKCEMVIGVGGGSVIDLAKAVAGLLNNEGSLLDYLEVVGRGQSLKTAAAPLIAVPTTAGTGAEVTANAVIRDPASRQKVSLRSPFLLPRVALVDPELTYTMPADVTAQSGVDALVHLVEAYTSKRAQPMTDPLCRDGISRVARSLIRAYENGGDKEAREDMAFASLQGGIVLANAGLGAVHGIAAVLGGSYSIPHGLACACLLPHVFRANAGKLRAERAYNPAFERYLHVAEWLAGGSRRTEDEAIDSGQAFMKDLIGRLRIPPLSRYGIKEEELPEIARKSTQASSTKANPVILSEAELLDILKTAIA